MAYLHEPTGMEVAGRFTAFKNIRRDIKSALSSSMVRHYMRESMVLGRIR